MTENRSGEFVQSLDRGLAVLRSFNHDLPAMTLADAARATGLTRATARRLLHTLVEIGYVTTDGKLFELSPKVLDLGYAYVSSLHLSESTLPQEIPSDEELDKLFQARDHADMRFLDIKVERA